MEYFDEFLESYFTQESIQHIYNRGVHSFGSAMKKNWKREDLQGMAFSDDEITHWLERCSEPEDYSI